MYVRMWERESVPPLVASGARLVPIRTSALGVLPGLNGASLQSSRPPHSRCSVFDIIRHDPSFDSISRNTIH